MATPVTYQVDTSVLNKAIPEVALLVGRTIAEQCVTSAGWICLNAQKATPFVSVARIDAELDVDRTPARGTARTTTQKFAQANKLGKLPWTEGMMIALQRTNPNSPYSKSTGNRWPLAYTKGMKGQMRWRFFQQAAERMKSSRHSSTHFLQAGWKKVVRNLFAHPLFQHAKKYRNAGTVGNEGMNKSDYGLLGNLDIMQAGSACVVTASNDIGDRVGSGNAILDAKHRAALLAHASGPLQDAVIREEGAMLAEIEKRLRDSLKDVNTRLGSP